MIKIVKKKIIFILMFPFLEEKTTETFFQLWNIRQSNLKVITILIKIKYFGKKVLYNCLFPEKYISNRILQPTPLKQ